MLLLIKKCFFLVLAGIAGEEAATTANLPEESCTLRQQADDALFRRVMPLVFVLNVLTLSTAFAKAEGRRYFGAAGALLIGTIAVTMVFNVPIIVAISAWKAGAAPETWRLERDRWLQANWLRTACGTMSFALSTLGLRS